MLPSAAATQADSASNALRCILRAGCRILQAEVNKLEQAMQAEVDRLEQVASAEAARADHILEAAEQNIDAFAQTLEQQARRHRHRQQAELQRQRQILSRAAAEELVRERRQRMTALKEVGHPCRVTSCPASSVSSL